MSGLHRVIPTRWQMAYYSSLRLIFSCKVDPVGFEPTTSSMPLRRAPSCAMGPCLLLGWGLRSGPGGIRTRDLISAIDARSQLRYRPLVSGEIVQERWRGVKQCRRKRAQTAKHPLKAIRIKPIERKDNYEG